MSEHGLDIEKLASGPLNPFTVKHDGVKGFHVLFEGFRMSGPAFRDEEVAKEIVGAMNAAYNVGFAAGRAERIDP